MTKQLRLITPTADDWRLDEHTRRLGLAGVAAARRVLAAARAESETPVEDNAA